MRDLIERYDTWCHECIMDGRVFLPFLVNYGTVVGIFALIVWLAN